MIEPAPKPKFPRAVALRAAKAVCDALKPACERIICAGSLRRGRHEVGDVEVLFVPSHSQSPWPDDLFSAAPMVNNAEVVITRLLNEGVLDARENAAGRTACGPKNKLLRHVPTGVPVDLFSATHENWWNLLVCRTGPAESNIRIAAAAQARGWRWNPYGAGFTSLADGTVVPMLCERAVFDFVSLPYNPQNRT